MLKTGLALRQLPVKMSARWLSSYIGGVRVREKMSEDDINYHRRRNLARKISAEYDVLDCYDDSFLNLEQRWSSENLEDLKGLLNDLKNINRKNGIVPPPPKDRTLRFYGHGGPIPDSWKPHKDDTGVVESAQLAVQEYNKQHGSSLEFVSVLSIEFRTHLGDCNFVIQSRDPAAARVSIKLHAHCNWPYRFVKQVVLYRPVSMINLLHKDERNKTDDGAVEALLYANMRNCPLIARRLGLKTQDLRRGNSPRSVHNLSSDDGSLMRVAQFAVNQKSNLHFLRVTGAWREEFVLQEWQKGMTDRRSLYHVIFEALEDGLERKFYSAISVNAECEAAKLVDLVPLDSPRPTIK